jgi:azurin
VERSANTGALYSKPGELAAHLAFTAAGGPASAVAATLPTVASVPDVTIQLGVIPNEMKYAQTQLTVQAGQMVELVFVNADQMQHNFVLGAQGSLQLIGAASDQMAAQPNAASLSYVPDIPQILFKTPLVNAGQTVRFQFRAPAEAGQYPYICTFPAHWRLMNGILNVTAPPARGGGGGGRAGGAPAGAAGGRAGGAAPPTPAPAPAAPAAPPGGRGQ